MPRVKSGNLYSLDHMQGDLYASFNSNPSIWYKYYEVPVDVYYTILDADSIGQAFDKLVLKTKTPYRYSKIQMVIAGTDPNTKEPVYSFPAQTGMRKETTEEPFDEFIDVISYLVSKGLARKEQDESGELRVVFTGQWATEMDNFFKRKISKKILE